MKPFLHKFVGKHILLLLVSFTIFSNSYSQSFLFGEKIKCDPGPGFAGPEGHDSGLSFLSTLEGDPHKTGQLPR